jgi:penicillin-binding protein 1A
MIIEHRWLMRTCHKNLIDALIATEDVRFYSHSGIDARGTLRALTGRGGGASTISQQLAKQLFTDQVSKNKLERALQKVREWIIAIRLERQYTKEEIIAQYFNIYDFGNNGDGIRSAARIYFGKEPSELDLKESAMLVGMLKIAHCTIQDAIRLAPKIDVMWFWLKWLNMNLSMKRLGTH